MLWTSAVTAVSNSDINQSYYCFRKKIMVGVAVVAGTTGALLAPAALAAAGFGAAGVAAGSLAAGWQATIGED